MPRSDAVTLGVVTQVTLGPTSTRPDAALGLAVVGVDGVAKYRHPIGLDLSLAPLGPADHDGVPFMA